VAGLVEVGPPPAALLGQVFAAGVVDEDAPHGLRGGGKEVSTAVSVLGLLDIDHAQVRLVDEGGRLQRLAGSLLG
jgi:hypothetical protein